MQIALVAVVLFAGMWFAVLRPKGGTETTAPVAPGTAGLSTAVDKANGAAAASDAANAATQAATGNATAPSTDAAATAPAATAKAPAKAKVAKAAAKPSAAASSPAKAKDAATPDESERLLAKIAKGKTVVMAFYGKGADDQAARRAVRRATKGNRHVVVGSAPITKVGEYEAMTSGVNVLVAPTVLVIGKDRKAVALTGYLDQRNVKQAIGDARRPAAKK